MERVKVNKAELLKILETNRGKHRQIFEEACDGYQKAVVRDLESQLKRAKEISACLQLGIAQPPATFAAIAHSDAN